MWKIMTLVGVLLLSGFHSRSLQAQVPMPTLDDLIKYGDGEMVQTAERLKAGLSRRMWTYVGDDGKSRTFEAAYQSTDVTRGKTWVDFSGRYRMELDRLSSRDQHWIASIKEYQQHVERDSRKLVRQLEAAVERERQEELARQEAARKEQMRRDPPVTVADVMVTSNATVVVGGQYRDVLVKRGEMLVVIDASDNEVICEIGGQQGRLSRQVVSLREVRRSELPARAPINGLVESRKPSIDSPDLNSRNMEPPRPAWPRKIDVDYDIISSGGGVQIFLNDVFAGGVGASMGLRRGDTIVRANNQDLRSDNHFREVVLSDTAPTFVVLDGTGRRRVVQFAPVAERQQRLFDGVKGRLNNQGDFEISYVSQHDPVTRKLQLERGVVILYVNDQAIRSVDDLRAVANNASNELTFVILPPGHSRPIEVTVR